MKNINFMNGFVNLNNENNLKSCYYLIKTPAGKVILEDVNLFQVLKEIAGQAGNSGATRVVINGKNVVNKDLLQVINKVIGEGNTGKIAGWQIEKVTENSATSIILTKTVK